MYTVSESIEIAAAPEVVRAKFLDFEQLPKYHPNGFFKQLGPKKPGEELKAGTQFHNVLEIGEFDSTIRENSPTKFQWGGGIAGIFNGEHSFHFEPSKTTPGGTTFTQKEEFTGGFAFVMGEGFIAKKIGIPEKTRTGWTKFNQDLKKWCEES